MPFIEITSLLSSELGLDPKDFNVQIKEGSTSDVANNILIPSNSQEIGIVVRVGGPSEISETQNPNISKSLLLAYDLIDWDFEPADIIYLPIFDSKYSKKAGANQKSKFKILEQYRSDINKLLEVCIQKSPIKKINFMITCPFGPSKLNVKDIRSVLDLWKLHDKTGLVFNTMYRI